MDLDLGGRHVLVTGGSKGIGPACGAKARLQGRSADEILQSQQQRMPLRRIATPQEIAKAVVFLASDRASSISGAIVAMDGAVSAIVV
ncbi:MAG: SDR family oxidoreductase [Ramlibacter sp.]